MIELTASDVTGILDFWFLPTTDPNHGKSRMEWFKKEETFDNDVKSKFGNLIENAVNGHISPKMNDPDALVAHIILLDQFTRNVYRGNKKTYQGDPIALTLSKNLLSHGTDLSLPPLHRVFVYMPLMHAESIEDQKLCVERFESLYKETNEYKSFLDYAVKHMEVVEKFGRFPHRNTIFERESTAQELEYLATPGAGF
jgi:uncharacterized protein (DUF924 family)